MKVIELKLKRMQLNLTQTKLSKEIGMSCRAYNLKENGKMKFSIEDMRKLIVALNLSLDEINSIFLDNILPKGNKIGG